MKRGDKVLYNIELSVVLHHIYGIGTVLIADGIDEYLFVEWEGGYKTWQPEYNLAGTPILIPLTEEQIINL